MHGVRRVPYRLPGLIAAVRAGTQVYLVEGEKDADRLHQLGLVSTTVPGGAGKFRPEFAVHFQEANVCIIADDDEPGRRHARTAGEILEPVVASLRVSLPAAGKDISDHLDAHLELADLRAITIAELRDREARHQETKTADRAGSAPGTRPQNHQNTSNDDFEDASPTGAADRWPTPEPLVVPVPAMQMAMLPDPIREPCCALAEASQTPPDLAVLIAWAALSAATRGHFRVRVTADWTEQLSIYTAVALGSGNRKSAVVTELVQPLYSEERRLQKLQAGQLRQDFALYQVAQARAKRAQDSAVKAATFSAEVEAEVRAAATAAGEMSEPTEIRLLAGDVTTEKLAVLMAEQDGAMAVLSAEGGLFGILAGRYSSEPPNLDLVLQAFTGEPFRVDRIGRPSVHIDSPHLALGLAVQPHVLAAANAVPAFTDLGLLPRFLFAVPPSNIGTRTVTAKPMPAAVSGQWHRTITRLLATALDHQGDQPITLTLDEPGLELLTQFRSQLEHRLHPDYGDLAHLTAWASKLPGSLVRLAGLFALAEHPTTTWVPESAMRSAIGLADYLIAHAEAAMRVGNRADIEPAAAVLRWLRNKHLSTFTVRDARQGVKGQAWCKNTADAQQAIDRLAELSWVAPAETPDPETPRPGRPRSPRYDVSPKVATSSRLSVGQTDPLRRSPAKPRRAIA